MTFLGTLAVTMLHACCHGKDIYFQDLVFSKVDLRKLFFKTCIILLADTFNFGASSCA